MSRPRRTAGVTLVEVLVAITLLSLLSTGMFVAMRIGLASFEKVDSKLMSDRRISGAQRILEEQLEGLIPVTGPCGQVPANIPFFQGQDQTMRLVSAFSLQEGWRGQPQFLELFVIPGDEGRGFRLVVNELRYTGPSGARQLCLGIGVDPETGLGLPRFAPVNPSPTSFVLADRLAYCRFLYLTPAPIATDPPIWKTRWAARGWPLAIRVEMAPYETDPSRLHPLTIVAPIRIHRSPEIPYVD